MSVIIVPACQRRLVCVTSIMGDCLIGIHTLKILLSNPIQLNFYKLTLLFFEVKNKLFFFYEF